MGFNPVDLAFGNMNALRSDNERLKVENAKLRELVRELYEDQCDEYDEWRYRDRMRELGIELNDCE